MYWDFSDLQIPKEFSLVKAIEMINGHFEGSRESALQAM